MKLRAYASYDGTITDLEFLRHFPALRAFAVDIRYGSLDSLEGLRHLPTDLASLTIGQTKRSLPLDGLARFTALKSLYIESQRRGIDVLADLGTLEDLTLRSITLPDLSLLTSLDRLSSLDLKLGGTTNLGLLPDVGQLKYLELWMIRGLADLSSIARLDHLEVLSLQSLKNVTRLPDLTKCTRLRHVQLETMKGLQDLEPLAGAPALQSIQVVDMPHLQPSNFACLNRSPTLLQVRAGLGSNKKNKAVVDLLGPTGSTWDHSLTTPSH